MWHKPSWVDTACGDSAQRDHLLPAKPDGTHRWRLRESPGHRWCLCRLISCIWYSLPPTPPLHCVGDVRWQNRYAPCSKADAFSCCWIGQRAGGSNREIYYNRKVYSYQCNSKSTPTSNPYPRKHEVWSMQMPCVSHLKETTSPTLRQHSHQHWTLWHPFTKAIVKKCHYLFIGVHTRAYACLRPNWTVASKSGRDSSAFIAPTEPRTLSRPDPYLATLSRQLVYICTMVPSGVMTRISNDRGCDWLIP